MRFFGRPETEILVVCTANICRSPMAEGLLRSELKKAALEKKVAVDSAGTHATQPGRRADPRAQTVCKQHGLEIGKCRARQVIDRDFERFDHILCMDTKNHQWLARACPESLHYKIADLATWLDGSGGMDIPDPYYGNMQGFLEVYARLSKSIENFVARELRS